VDYLPGRVIVLVFALIAAAAVGILGAVDPRRQHRITRVLRLLSIGAWLAGTVLFLSFMEVFRWIPYARADFPALGLAVMGLAVYWSWPERQWARIAAAVLFVAAGYCKQTMLAAPMACILHRVAVAGWGAGLRFGGLYAALGLAPFILLTVVTEGQFPRHTISYNVNTMEWDRLVVWVRHGLRFHAAIFALGVLGAVVLWRQARARLGYGLRRSAGETQHGFALGMRGLSTDVRVVWFVLAWAQFPTIAKAGTAENYLLEPLAATSVIVVAGIVAFGRIPNLGRALTLLGAAAIAVLVHWAYMTGRLGGQNWTALVYQNRPTDQNQWQTFQTVLRELRRRGEPAFAEFGNYHLALNQPILYQPFIMSELARQGKWDPAPFLRMIRDQQLTIIILERSLDDAVANTVLTAEMAEAIRDNYWIWPESPVVLGRGRTHVYLPRNGPRANTANLGTRQLPEYDPTNGTISD
jgi:hypothetical protein